MCERGRDRQTDRQTEAEMNGVDDITVVIAHGQQQDDPSVISIICLDQLGLACDITRVLFDFSLHIIEADMSKDGQWCLLIFRVRTPQNQPLESVEWARLKKHLVSACPPTRSRLFGPLLSEPKPNKCLYILQTWSSDRLGLLNDIASILWELEVVVHKMKASTSPENRAVNIFYITDIREMLHEKQRQELLCRCLKAVLGEGNVNCKVSEAGPQWGGLECTPVPAWHPLFSSSSSLDGKSEDLGWNFVKPSDLTGFHLSSPSITWDNSLSPAHSLLQISCRDRRGLVYDCMRTLKDCEIQVVFGRLLFNSEGYGDIDLFILEADGGKIVAPERQKQIFGHLEHAILQPVNVRTWSRGPDTELVVATPIELCERGRPKVLCDTTAQLRKLGLGIFQANIERGTISDRNWEIYRFLFTERPDFLLPDFISPNDSLKRNISEQIMKTLIT